MPLVGMIWAQGDDRAIGAGGRLPWHLPEDLAIFKRVTMGCPVIMGRRTWLSLDERFRPLPGRANIVLTRNAAFAAPGAEVASSVGEALAKAGDAERIWIIGGATVYEAAFEHAGVLVVTSVDCEVPGADAFAPAVDFTWKLAEAVPERGWLTSRTGLRYRCSVYHRPGLVLPPLLEADR